MDANLVAPWYYRMFNISGKKLCWDCAIKFLGIQGEPYEEQRATLQGFGPKIPSEDSMLTLVQALNAINVGDVIFGLGAGGQEKLLLVYRADGQGFSARHVTTQMMFRFGRDGKTRVYADGGYITIVSTARLPADVYDVALGLDRKFAAQPEYPDGILTKAEIELLRMHAEFFKACLLPGTETMVRRADKLNGVRAILQLEWDPVNARDNPPDWNEYLGNLPALVDLLERQASVDEVADFLADVASRRTRTLAVADRGKAAAASLVRLRQSWESARRGISY